MLLSKIYKISQHLAESERSKIPVCLIRHQSWDHSSYVLREWSQEFHRKALKNQGERLPLNQGQIGAT